jgi:hypothetical protein
VVTVQHMLYRWIMQLIISTMDLLLMLRPDHLTLTLACACFTCHIWSPHIPTHPPTHILFAKVPSIALAPVTWRRAPDSVLPEGVCVLGAAAGHSHREWCNLAL